MKHKIRKKESLVAVFLLLCSSSCSNSKNEENEELKAQIDALQSQVNEIQQTETTTGTSNIIEDIIVDSIMDGYEKAEKVTHTNTNASSIKNEIDAFLTSLDTQGAGMTREKSNIQIIDITVNNYVWNVSAVDPTLFESTDKMVWGKEGVGNKNDKRSGATNAETYLAIDLAQLYPEFENASLKVILSAGRCKGVALTLDKNTPLEEVVDCPKIIDGEFDSTFDWGVMDGITQSGLIVGTAPVVKS